MAEKIGRNDPCPCGSGKKYKSCCMQQQQQYKTSTLGGKRKFTAKVISAGGTHKQKPAEEISEDQSKQPVDYSTLMERSFGDSLHSYEEKPPMPINPSQYLVKEEKEESNEK